MVLMNTSAKWDCHKQVQRQRQKEKDDVTNKRQTDTMKWSRTAIAKLKKRICGFSEFLESVA
jgi:hypothetical protein